MPILAHAVACPVVPTRLRENLFMLMQRALPARLLARLVYRASRSTRPWLKTLLIDGFRRLYRIELAEAAQPDPAAYPSFNAFFARALQPGARPTCGDAATIVSPADGRIQQIGRLSGDALLQVKGSSYAATELLGGDAQAAAVFCDGSFITIYLAPWNYHRVHMPVAGRIRRMVHVPGELWSVNATTAARVPRLFSRNERLVCLGESGWGPWAMVLVGALNVGSISTSWAGEVLPRRERDVRHWDYAADDPAVSLGRGALLGQFNLGSTVLLLLPPGASVWRDDLAPGDELRFGMAIGQLTVRPTAP